jgi:GT2 family glycosyltransferase
VDFGLRCALAGLGGEYVPEAVAYHQGSATLGRWHGETVRKIARNQLLLVAKHYPPNWILRYGWPVFIAQILWGFIALRHGALFSYLAGKGQGLRQFRQFRHQRGADHAATGNLPAILERSEEEIRAIQQLTGFDLYWKLYFALT